ncbi:MAG: hypothetical protein IRZ16_23700 [Myxococcaceae bacterium]|nr:hypothetical protein [Myxococcaceae bacterium]
MKTTPIALAMWMLALGAGCGGASTGGPDAGVLDKDAGNDPVDSGTPDAGLPCEGATVPCTVHWTEAEPFPVRVDHHTAFAHSSPAGDFVYVAGGVVANNEAVAEIYASVRRAKVNADGSLGPWESLADLPRRIAFHAMALTAERVYLVAGVTGQAPGSITTQRAVLVGDFEDDGTITWRVGPNLPESFLHPSAQVVGGRLYVIGGSGGMMDPKDKVYVSTLDETGMPSAFTAGPSLPEPRSHHVTLVHDGRIYLVGGFRGDQRPIDEVLRSVHDGTGAVTGWELAGAMKSAPWTAAGFVYGEWIYVLGGGEGGPGHERYVNRVRRGHFNALGAIANGFEDVQNSLPIARAHVHHTPVVHGHVYSIGGRDETFSSLDRVFIGEMTAE